MSTTELDQYTSTNAPEGYATIISYFMSNVDYAPETPRQALNDELFIKCLTG